MAKSTRELLVQAKSLIDTPSKWCQRANARNVDGAAVNAADPTAVKWCIAGALTAVVSQHTERSWASTDTATFYACSDVLNHALGPPDPVRFNTKLVVFNNNPATTHADVMALFDRAIASCAQERAENRKREREYTIDYQGDYVNCKPTSATVEENPGIFTPLSTRNQEYLSYAFKILFRAYVIMAIIICSLVMSYLFYLAFITNSFYYAVVVVMLTSIACSMFIDYF